MRHVSPFVSLIISTLWAVQFLLGSTVYPEDAAVVPLDSIPQPIALLLLGSGLLVVAVGLRRRFK